MSRIYFDHNATTRLHPEARAALAPLQDERFGNPSSVHRAGRLARDALERARDEVAALVGARAEEIVFTSGGTEGDNLAVLGAARAARARSGGTRRRVVSSPLEHPAVRGSLALLAAEGFEVALVPVTPAGEITPPALAALVDERTALVTVQAANHEIGVLHPVRALSELAHAAGALAHTDAVQAAGKVLLDVGELGVDLLTLSGHKLYGPKGIGALYLRRGLDLAPLVVGGHQERERRAGTENVAGAVGMGAACRVARRELGRWSAHTAALRDRLEQGALAIAGARRFGAAGGRVPGTASLGWEGVAGELVMMGLDLEGVAVSTGSACTSGSLDPSPVILALGVGEEAALTATRFSLGWENTAAEVDEVLALLGEIVARVRAVSA